MLENGIRDISGEVRNSLDFHRSQDGGGEVSHVVLSGSAQDIPGFAEALQSSLGVEVRCEELALPDGGLADERLPAPSGRRHRARRRGGSAMRAVNLIPADQRSGASVGAGRSQGGAYAVLALAVGLALIAVPLRQRRHESPAGARKSRWLTAQAHNAQAAAEQLAPYTSFIALREQRTQAVNTLVDSRFDWAHVFHEFGRVLPLQTSISSLTGTIGAGSPTGSPRPLHPFFFSFFCQRLATSTPSRPPRRPAASRRSRCRAAPPASRRSRRRSSACA